MALSYPISKALFIKREQSEAGNIVAAIEFRYVFFRLELDDMAKVAQLHKILSEALIPKEQKKESISLPRFYNSNNKKKSG